MIEFKLPRADAARLAAFLRWRRPHASITAHWEHFASLNRIDVNPDTGSVRLAGGPGFDSDYELNFRRRSLRELGALAFQALSGRNDRYRFERAFRQLWGDRASSLCAQAARVLGSPLTAHKILAVHYMQLLVPHLPNVANQWYVEIGPGTGYLAALIHSSHPGSMFLIDIPEILPFSFLYLHRLLPDVPYRLPHEVAPGFADLEEGALIFLAPEQLEAIPTHRVDLAVNTASFGEMLPSDIRKYFSFLRGALKPGGLFFNANRVEKWMVAPDTGEQVPIRFDDYPWSAGDNDVFFEKSRFHELVQPESPVNIRLCRLETR